eukprot:sb/3462577/
MGLNPDDPVEYAFYRKVITHPIFFVFGGLYFGIIFAFFYIASRPEEEEHKNVKPRRVTRRERAPARKDTFNRGMEGLFVPKLSVRDFRFGKDDPVAEGGGTGSRVRLNQLSTVMENPAAVENDEKGKESSEVWSNVEIVKPKGKYEFITRGYCTVILISKMQLTQPLARKTHRVSCSGPIQKPSPGDISGNLCKLVSWRYIRDLFTIPCGDQIDMPCRGAEECPEQYHWCHMSSHGIVVDQRVTGVRLRELDDSRRGARFSNRKEEKMLERRLTYLSNQNKRAQVSINREKEFIKTMNPRDGDKDMHHLDRRYKEAMGFIMDYKTANSLQNRAERHNSSDSDHRRKVFNKLKAVQSLDVSKSRYVQVTSMSRSRLLPAANQCAELILSCHMSSHGIVVDQRVTGVRLRELDDSRRGARFSNRKEEKMLERRLTYLSNQNKRAQVSINREKEFIKTMNPRDGDKDMHHLDRRLIAIIDSFYTTYRYKEAMGFIMDYKTANSLQNRAERHNSSDSDHRRKVFNKLKAVQRIKSAPAGTLTRGFHRPGTTQSRPGMSNQFSKLSLDTDSSESESEGDVFRPFTAGTRADHSSSSSSSSTTGEQKRPPAGTHPTRPLHRMNTSAKTDFWSMLRKNRESIVDIPMATETNQSASLRRTTQDLITEQRVVKLFMRVEELKNKTEALPASGLPALLETGSIIAALEKSSNKT